MVKLVFNDFNKTCVIKGKRVQLTQEGFLLLRLLYEAKFRPVAFQTLKSTLWTDDYQPDFSLKKLARELQQQLIKAGIDDIQVVVVEEVGYALKAKTSSRIFFLAAFVAMAVIMYLFINVISPMVRSASMVNNRIVFLPEELPNTIENVLYHEAVDRMRTLITESDILLMINNNMSNDIARELIGKYNNAGLIIEWYSVDDDEDVRLEIYEPLSKNLLSSVSFNRKDFNKMNATLMQQVANIERLLTSELLPLSDNAIANPYDPVWDKIRVLLSQTADEVN